MTSHAFEIEEPDEEPVRYPREDQSLFLGAVDYTVRRGRRLIVTIAKTASETIDDLNKIFKKHNVAVKITADSDPRAIDYFFSALGGATFGAGIGAAASAGFWAAVKTYKVAVGADLAVPGLGQAIGIPAAIGAAFGAAVGLSTTYYGLRIRFEAINGVAPKPGSGNTEQASKDEEALALHLAPMG